MESMKAESLLGKNNFEVLGQTWIRFGSLSNLV